MMPRAIVVAVMCATIAATSVSLRGQIMPAPQATPAPPALTLADLERMALEHNPTLPQAASEIEAARGRAKQAGLLPNPTIGYSGDEISGGPVIRGGQHGLFVDQTIPLGGKLGLSRRIFEQQTTEAEALRDVQRQRVVNDVRALYYGALAAERRVDLRRELARIADEAVGVSRQLFNTGAADSPDVLSSEIEARQTQLVLEAALNDRFRVWRQLAALVGDASLTPGPLEGSLDAPIPELQRDVVLRQILSESPELRAAHANVDRAQAALTRARREPIPDLVVRGGSRYNRELVESAGRPIGWQAFIDAGLVIPLFNRNPGGIAESGAELGRAQREVTRLELSLQSRAADVFDEYLTNLRYAETYRRDIIPRAEESYRLYLARYREMGAAYPQVLVAQRTLSQVSEDYVRSAEMAWMASVRLQGLLLGGGLDAAPRVGEVAPAGLSGASEGPMIGMGMGAASGVRRQ